MDKFRLLDLFSGIGGFSLGLERSGYFETVAFCEIEDFPRRVLKKHWPKVPCYGDIRELDGARLVRERGRIDAICGGFPCQDISLAGLGAGIEGERSGLWKQYARIIGEIRPRYVIVENVSALLGRGMGTVLADLSEIGYDAEWHCIPASYVGHPHERDRVWIVAHPREERKQGIIEGPLSRIARLPWGENVRRATQWRDRSDLPSPLFRGTRDGISNWMDRLAALGNAVVPQIPEIIGRAIGEYETMRKAA